MPASAGAATADDTPGTTSNGMPARASASASSPPRPNTNGSPLLRRTTRRPRRAYFNQQAVQNLLIDGLPAGALADEEPAGPGRVDAHLLGGERVVEDQIGIAEAPHPAHGDEVGAARPGPDQAHPPASGPVAHPTLRALARLA